MRYLLPDRDPAPPPKLECSVDTTQLTAWLAIMTEPKNNSLGCVQPCFSLGQKPSSFLTRACNEPARVGAAISVRRMGVFQAVGALSTMKVTVMLSRSIQAHPAIPATIHM